MATWTKQFYANNLSGSGNLTQTLYTVPADRIATVNFASVVQRTTSGAGVKAQFLVHNGTVDVALNPAAQDVEAQGNGGYREDPFVVDEGQVIKLKITAPSGTYDLSVFLSGIEEDKD